MIRVNENYLKLKSSYLFSEISRKVSAFQKENPDKEIIRLGIGDVTRALPPACIEAFHAAVDEMANDSTFRGYGPDQGYDFLRKKIAAQDFQSRGAEISADEVFISDGAKCDTGNFQELFSNDITIAVPDPVYPVYVDTNVMAGRTGAFDDGRYSGLHYLDCTEENGFVPKIPGKGRSYLSLFSNNPTGAVASKDILREWRVRTKRAGFDSFDAAYSAFYQRRIDSSSIYEIGWPMWR